MAVLSGGWVIRVLVRHVLICHVYPGRLLRQGRCGICIHKLVPPDASRHGQIRDGRPDPCSRRCAHLCNGVISTQLLRFAHALGEPSHETITSPASSPCTSVPAHGPESPVGVAEEARGHQHGHEASSADHRPVGVLLSGSFTCSIHCRVCVPSHARVSAAAQA